MAEDGSTTQKWAMFMAGLTLLQSLRVALTGAKFALDRFKIPQQYASSFINMVHNPMELATFTGMAIVTITTLCTDSSNDGFRYLAIVTNVTLCCSFILLLYTFISGGELGDLTSYYWAIVFVSFIYGLNVATVMTVGSANAACFNMGIPLSGIQVCIYYYVFNKLAERFNWSNVSYKIIVWQLIIAIIISAVSAGLWVYIAIQGPSGEAGDKQAKDMGFAVLSPILMGIVGMGGIYAFYPAIAPYKLTDVSTGYTIDLVVLFASAVPAIIIAVVCSCSSVGPDRPWKTDNNTVWWHLTWLLAIPHILAMVLCFVTLHYPDSGVAGSIKSSGRLVGLITITLKFCEEGLKAVSYSGAGKQVGKYCSCTKCTSGTGCECCNGGQICKPENCTSNNCKCCKEREGTYSSVNAFTSQGLMIILAFTGDGYLKTYSKYEHDRSKWPTKDCGFWRSIGYWTWNGMKVACKSVKSSFTKNVRCKVLGKSEALLIVYADEEF